MGTLYKRPNATLAEVSSSMTMTNTVRAAALVVFAVTAPAAFAADAAAPATAAAPVAAAGPTIAAAEAFCGDPSGKANELLARYSTAKGLKEVYKSDQFVAYSDDDKASTVTYTFTLKTHAAHPAAVCRKLVKEGDALIVKMVVVCDGEAGACSNLNNDFNVLNAKMQAEVDQQIAGAKK